MVKKKLQKSFNCPTEFTLDVLGGKWKTVILCYLKQRPLRYAQLRKLVPKLSDKMLTERLADLVEVGLVNRKKLSGESRIEVYALAPMARSLHALLRDLYKWGKQHASEFGVSVGDPSIQLDT